MGESGWQAQLACRIRALGTFPLTHTMGTKSLAIRPTCLIQPASTKCVGTQQVRFIAWGSCCRRLWRFTVRVAFKLQHWSQRTTMIGNPQNHHDPEDVDDIVVDLTIHRGRAQRLVRSVTGPVFTIGAAETCEMVLGDIQFPDVHSYVCIRAGVVSMRYLGEGPTVTVNGREVRWGELLDGDRIRTGPFEFRTGIRYSASDKGTRSGAHEISTFSGSLGDLPLWWSSVSSSGSNWQSLTTDKGCHVGRFGLPQGD